MLASGKEANRGDGDILELVFAKVDSPDTLRVCLLDLNGLASSGFDLFFYLD